MTHDFSDRRVWRLLLSLGMDSLKAIFYNIENQNCVPYLCRQWHLHGPEILPAIEDAVYQDPLILDDYRTTILLRPQATVLVPPGFVDVDDRGAVVKAFDGLGIPENPDVWVEDMAGAVSLFYTPGGLKDFLGRTFLTEEVCHVWQPLVTHFQPKATMQGGEVSWVNMTDKGLDIIAFRDGKLCHLASWCTDTPADAAYYIVYAWRAIGFDAGSGELYISAPAPIRGELIAMLRRHINYVSLLVASSALNRLLDTGINLSEALTLANFIK